VNCIDDTNTVEEEAATPGPTDVAVRAVRARHLDRPNHSGYHRPMRALAAAACVLLGGCWLTYDWQDEVRRQASFDHQCPEHQVVILRDNDNSQARAVYLDVCGRQRLYRDIGGRDAYVWQDMTRMTTGGENPDPR
jgi:hypothetical protein